MARQNSLIAVLLLTTSGCTHGVLVESNHDASLPLESGEGRVSGHYVTPLLLSERPIDRLANPGEKSAALVFRGTETGRRISVQSGTDGVFSFRAPADEYELASVRSAVRKGGEPTIRFRLRAGETISFGSIYSSCLNWNENSASEKKFRDLIVGKKYRTYQHHYSDERSTGCLVFWAP